MTHLTIFGFEYEGDNADTILLHANLADAEARGKVWLEDEHHSYDYMKIMLLTRTIASEVARVEWA